MPKKLYKKIVKANQKVLINNYLLANLNESCFNFCEFMQEFEKELIKSALCLTHYNQKRASSILGIKPTTLNEKMKKHKIFTTNLELKDLIDLDLSEFPQE